MYWDKDCFGDRLSRPLPAKKAHLVMAPDFRVESLRTEVTFPENAKISAVAIILFQSNGRLHLPLIKRSLYDGVHSGQIALPGGKYEPNVDNDLVDTALRETYEELGVFYSRTQVMGMLSKIYVPPSNFLIQPIVVYDNKKPITKHNIREVQEVVSIEINELKDPLNNKRIEVEVHGLKQKAPAYIIGENMIWGATAMILNELLQVLEEISS